MIDNQDVREQVREALLYEHGSSHEELSPYDALWYDLADAVLVRLGLRAPGYYDAAPAGFHVREDVDGERLVPNDDQLTVAERSSLTVWGETFSAQIRPGGMALYMRPEAPRSTEDGQPYLIEWPDVAKLRTLLEAVDRQAAAVHAVVDCTTASERANIRRDLDGEA